MNKAVFTMLLSFFFFAPISHAAFNFDGCYQLYKPSVMFPAFCLDGTTEEGINGAGVRLVIFQTNTDIISAWAVSTALGGLDNSLEFILDSNRVLVLSQVKMIGSRLEGTATFGKTDLRFLQLDHSTSQRLLSKFYAEPKCKTANPGEIVKLK